MFILTGKSSLNFQIVSGMNGTIVQDMLFWISNMVSNFICYSQLINRAPSILASGHVNVAVSYINAVLAQDYGKELQYVEFFISNV